jgi:hypothetical protein
MDAQEQCRRCHGTKKIKYAIAGTTADAVKATEEYTIEGPCTFCKIPLPSSSDEEKTYDRYLPEVEFSVPSSSDKQNPKQLGEEIEKAAREALLEIAKQRESISKAFIAETGCHPSEVVQIIEQTPNGVKWRIEKSNSLPTTDKQRERPQISVSEWCEKTNEQLCDICDDILCGDNENPKIDWVRKFINIRTSHEMLQIKLWYDRMVGRAEGLVNITTTKEQREAAQKILDARFEKE